MFSLRRFWKSYQYARQGLQHAFRTEHSFRIHILALAIVAVLMLILGVGGGDAAILVLTMSVIVTLELTNTVVERLVGILEPRIHPTVGVVKDLMAAAVLLTSIASAIIGLIILWPYFTGAK